MEYMNPPISEEQLRLMGIHMAGCRCDEKMFEVVPLYELGHDQPPAYYTLRCVYCGHAIGPMKTGKASKQ